MNKVQITRVEYNQRQKITDKVARELTLKVILNNQLISDFTCSGTDINELVAGYLFFHKYISEPRDIVSLEYNIDSGDVIAETRKTQDTLAYKQITGSHEYKADDIFSLMKIFLKHSEEFDKTGAVHSAGIADSKRVKFVYEDLSRHNAIFKILGYSLLNNEPLDNKILLLTCRITQSILDIILKTNVKTIITKAAPTSLSVETCKRENITLAGFVRGERMNIYHGGDYILSQSV